MAGAKGKTKKKPPVKAAPSKPKSVQRAKPPARPVPRPPARSEPMTTAAPTVGKPVFTSAQPAVRPRPLITGDFTLDKLHQIALTATNLDTAVEFYRDILGLKFVTRFDPPGLAFFTLGGGVRLMLSSTFSQATLYFLVDNVDDAVRELKKRGVSFLHPPAMLQRDDAGTFGKKGNEEWMAFFKDPSGNLLGLVERR
jgi:catechol 2,3-dioxygenase-like lactoylglutathione lyase family enzyme